MKRLLTLLILQLFFNDFGIAQYKRNIEGSRSMENGKLITELDAKKDIYSRVKILKKEKSYGLIKGAIHFKTIDVGAALLGKGQGRTNVVSYAMLEGITEADMNEIAVQFHTSFTEKLNNLGFTQLDWSQIESAKKYPNLKEKAVDKLESNKSIGNYTVFTVDNRPHFKLPGGNLGTFNNMKSISKEIGAPLLSYDIIVDFARFDIEASRWRTDGYGPGYDFVTTNTSANILPQIGIESILQDSGPLPILFYSGINVLDAVGRFDDVRIQRNLYVYENYALDIDSYKGEIPASMKRLITINTSNTGTFVVKADKEKYKRIVLQALDTFSDYLIESIQNEIQ